MHNKVRIIGGKWRSRVLRFSSLPGLRPTPDRVRETLFNWLGQDLTGRTTLELFAGTGALSLEALSRGAQRAVCVERDPRAIAELSANAERLQAGDALELHRADALAYLRTEARRFHVIFLDPPYAEDWPSRLWPWLAERLVPAGLVYVEHPKPLQPPPDWEVWRQDKAGQVHYHLLRFAGPPDAQ
jgi:16S rRNA (guanine966-N2)-methyltransferase